MSTNYAQSLVRLGDTVLIGKTCQHNTTTRQHLLHGRLIMVVLSTEHATCVMRLPRRNHSFCMPHARLTRSAEVATIIAKAARHIIFRENNSCKVYRRGAIRRWITNRNTDICSQAEATEMLVAQRKVNMKRSGAGTGLLYLDLRAMRQQKSAVHYNIRKTAASLCRGATHHELEAIAFAGPRYTAATLHGARMSLPRAATGRISGPTSRKPPRIASR